LPHSPVTPANRTNAKRMRSHMTEAELKLWNELHAARLMGLKFRRQVPIGNYIVDFACPSCRVIVELDGSQHADDEIVLRDSNRTKFLQSQGWHVLRFWNHDVLQDIDNVCRHFWMECDQRTIKR
jgi:very-short-patch-repair endonuclease